MLYKLIKSADVTQAAPGSEQISSIERRTKLVQREQLQPLNLRQMLRKISSYPVLSLPTEVLQSFRSPVSSHKHLSLLSPSLSRSHTHRVQFLFLAYLQQFLHRNWSEDGIEVLHKICERTSRVVHEVPHDSIQVGVEDRPV